MIKLVSGIAKLILWMFGFVYIMIRSVLIFIWGMVRASVQKGPQ